MVQEEKLKSQNLKPNKNLYKLELMLLKILPMLIALIHLCNIIFSYFSIDLPILSYVGGISFIPLIFMYLSSYVFQFCEYHRMFLHYIVIDNLICIYDLYIGIPIEDLKMLKIHISILGICLFIILYLYKRNKNEKENRRNI